MSESPFADDTVIIITEDDCQDGPDHVDSHRAATYVVGPYVKQRAVVHTHYSQVNALRTIEDLLGTQHINLNTAMQRPMTDLFDLRGSGQWSFVAEASTLLEGTEVALAPDGLSAKFARGPRQAPKRDAQYWAEVTARFDFSEADHVPPAEFNRVLWKGLMGDQPYPKWKGRPSRPDLDD